MRQQYFKMQSPSAKLQNMNWDDLRYVLSIARSGTLTEAAKRLEVNQTTVSRRLESIEKSLGVRIFKKTPTGIVLTANGNELLPDAEQIELLINNVQRNILGKDLKLSGPLRITTIDVSAIYDNSLFISFNKCYPDVMLEISNSYTPQNLTKREADIAIRWTNHPPEHLVGRKLTEINYGLYAHENIHVKFGSDFKNINYPWLDWDDSMGANVTKRWMSKQVPNAKIVAKLDSAVAMIQSVRNGFGVSFIPKIYANEMPELICIYEPGKEFNVDIWVLTHPDLRNTARVSAFMSHAFAYYKITITAYTLRLHKISS